MFLSYYGLREQPFGVTPDPRFLYFGQVHREALASLVYGVEAGLGFTSLIAEPGTGKTTLLYYILGHYRATARTAFIFDTQCTSRELLRNLLVEFEIDGVNESDPAGWLNQLKEFLAVQARARRRVLVVLDEAQNFDDSVLETIRLLSNFETAGSKLLHIILSGQPQLAEKLSQPALLNVRQRITVATRLRPFAPVDVVKYVAHRLSVAGYQGNALFTAAALESLARLSGGIPREINRLCFGAMSMGCALDRKMIDADVLREVANDFDFSTLLSAAPAPNSIELPPAEQLQQVFAEALARAQKAGAAAQEPRPPKPAAQAMSNSVPRPQTSGLVTLELSRTAPAVEACAPAMAEGPQRPPARTPAHTVAPHASVSRDDETRILAEPRRRTHASPVAAPVAPAREVQPRPAAAVKAATVHRPAVPTVAPSLSRQQHPAPMVPLQSWIASDNSRRGPRRPALIAAALALIAAAAIAIQLLPTPAVVAPAQQIVQPADEAPAAPAKPAPHTRNHGSSVTPRHDLSRYAASPGGVAPHSTYEQRRTNEAANRR
jgi:general secretion pathway protein A